MTEPGTSKPKRSAARTAVAIGYTVIAILLLLGMVSARIQRAARGGYSNDPAYAFGYVGGTVALLVLLSWVGARLWFPKNKDGQS